MGSGNYATTFLIFAVVWVGMAVITGRAIYITNSLVCIAISAIHGKRP